MYILLSNFSVIVTVLVRNISHFLNTFCIYLELNHKHPIALTQKHLGAPLD